MKKLFVFAMVFGSISSFANVNISCVDVSSFKNIELKSKNCVKLKAELEKKLFQMRSKSKTRALIENDKTLTVLGNYFGLHSYSKAAIISVLEEGPATAYHTNESSLVIEYDSDGSLVAPFGGQLYLGERGEAEELICIDVKQVLKKAGC